MARSRADAVIARWCRKRAIARRERRPGYHALWCVYCGHQEWVKTGPTARTKYCSAACYRADWATYKRNRLGKRPPCLRCGAPMGRGRRKWCDTCAKAQLLADNARRQRERYAAIPRPDRVAFASRYPAVEELRSATPPGRCLWCDRETKKMAHRHAILCGSEDCDRLQKNLYRRERTRLRNESIAKSTPSDGV